MEKSLLRPEGRAAGAQRFVRPVMALLLLLGVLVCGNAWAAPGGRGHGGYGHGGHGHSRTYFGLSIGAPLYWGGGPGYGPGWYGPGWYGDPYWGPPRTVLVRPAAPVVYVERGATAAAVWYFCNNPQGYYPYVKQCTGAWRTVPSQPAIR